MTGETSYYYPAALYCRERFREGDFGRVVYGEGEYYHDWEHGLYAVQRTRGGQRWLEHAGAPPMYYPTHSMSMIVSVTGAYATHVSCQGVVDRARDDGVYGERANVYGNVFSNESALFRMSDGLPRGSTSSGGWGIRGRCAWRCSAPRAASSRTSPARCG